MRDPNYWGRDLRGAPRHEQLRPHHRQDLPRQHRAARGAEGRRIRPDAVLLGGRLDAPPERASASTAASWSSSRSSIGSPDGFYSYVLNNLRWPKFQDRRVRMALELAMDYEWMNRQLFRGSYKRVKGIFGNTRLRGQRPAVGAGGWRCWSPSARSCPPETFGPDGAAAAHRRRQLACAPTCARPRRCSRRRAGPTATARCATPRAKPFTIEFLDSTEAAVGDDHGGLAAGAGETGHRVAAPRGRLRPVPGSGWTPFKFEMIGISFPGTHFPGSEYADLFGSKAADTPGSGNSGGHQESGRRRAGRRTSRRPTTGDEFLAACRALDRVIAHEHYMMPAWTSSETPHRLQRLDARAPGHGAAVSAGGRAVHGLAHDHLVGTHAAQHAE